METNRAISKDLALYFRQGNCDLPIIRRWGPSRWVQRIDRVPSAYCPRSRTRNLSGERILRNSLPFLLLRFLNGHIRRRADHRHAALAIRRSPIEGPVAFGKM